MENLVAKIQLHLAEVAQNPAVRFNQNLLSSFDRHLSGKFFLNLTPSFEKWEMS